MSAGKKYRVSQVQQYPYYRSPIVFGIVRMKLDTCMTIVARYKRYKYEKRNKEGDETQTFTHIP